MSDTTAVKSLITPHDQTLRTVFSAQRSYYIDIYQREYKWTEDNVRTLLNDIEVRFNLFSRPKSNPKDIQEDVLDRYEPYFLNTYLTSSTTAHTAIVDGQQRLTTLLLVLIKLFHVLKLIEAKPVQGKVTFASDTLRKLIFETNDFGGAERFKIFNENREDAFRALVEGRPIRSTDQTRTRIAANYKAIDEYFENFLRAEPGKSDYDIPKITYYLTYLLDRVSIVEVRIERQENVAMIFEVVNDRGLGLRPYEILKGKLIGNLSASQKESANGTWTSLQEKYFRAKLKNTTESSLSLDTFFQAFFRAKFADTESDYERFEGDYHYEIYRNPAVRAYFGDFRDRDVLYERLSGDIKYFAELYLDIRTGYAHEALVFNKLLDQNQQYLLVLSALRRDDPKRDAKINAIGAKFDQFHVVLRLLDAYDSNAFQRLIYALNKEVRESSLADIKRAFEATLIASLVADGIIQDGAVTSAAQLFEFERFKAVRNQWTNFSKYVLMRIDRRLAQVLDKPSYASSDLEELEGRFNKNNLKRYGMHLEHIYTQHSANRSLFVDANGVFDEAAFTQTRNRLGMVLLLKDRQNISSSNEVYEDKRTAYAQSNLIWNELLVGHVPGVDLRNLPDALRPTPIDPENRVFPLGKVEERQRVMFEAIRFIWGEV